MADPYLDLQILIPVPKPTFPRPGLDLYALILTRGPVNGSTSPDLSHQRRLDRSRGLPHNAVPRPRWPSCADLCLVGYREAKIKP
jgi:hypothetical protein